jgi:hypothetical protein
MGSGAMTYIQIFIKTGLGIQKFIIEDTHRQQSDHISQLLFFLNEERMLKEWTGRDGTGRDGTGLTPSSPDESPPLPTCSHPLQKGQRQQFWGRNFYLCPPICCAVTSCIKGICFYSPSIMGSGSSYYENFRTY